MIRSITACILLYSCLAVRASLADDRVAQWIAQIQAAGAEGAGSAEARVARDKLVAGGPETLPLLLDGMSTPNIVAANWLRTAFDEVLARSLRSEPVAIPVEKLRDCVLDTKRPGRVRRLALAVLTQLDPATPSRLIPPLLDDPEFRHDAVAAALAEADRAAVEQRVQQALALYSRAFDAARDVDQVRTIAAKLKTLGRDVNIADHMGFLVDWYVIGPFDGPEFTAFSREYPPQREIQLDARYAGQKAEVSWQRYRTSDEFGTVDLVTAIGAADDAAAFAYTVVEVPEARTAQIRCGADDNLTVWLNGQKVFAKEEWQNGTRLDRFMVPVQLVKGPNRILVKVCQGPKYRDPGMANLWSLQMRICTEDGKGIAFPSEQ